MTGNVILKFAYTHVRNVVMNTDKRFEAILEDKWGIFKAVVIKKGDKTLNVYFDGAGLRKGLSNDYVKWEYEEMWKNLAEQGVIVNVIN